MLNDVVIIEKKHTNAAITLFDRVMRDIKPKFIISISGEVGTGKCEIAHELARLLIESGKQVKLLLLDNYYFVAPKERNQWREKTFPAAPALSYGNALLLQKCPQLLARAEKHRFNGVFLHRVAACDLRNRLGVPVPAQK